MTLWIILTVMCSAAAVLVTVPLVRRYEKRDEMAAGTAVFKDQLKEIDRDMAQGLISADDAGLARLEIERRILAAAKSVSGPRPVSQLWRNAALAAAAALVVVGSVSIYALQGRPELAQPSPAEPDLASLLAKLEQHLQSNPGDAEGWRMLGLSYFNMQRYQQAAEAYGKAHALDASAANKTAYAEALTLAAGGAVTPQAQALLAEVLKADPKEERARYYDALAREQAGDSAAALERWKAMLADSPPDAPWRGAVEARIKSLSDQAMISGMVEGLAARLEQSPRDAEGWKKLIRSRIVLKQPDLARESLKKALAAFADDKAASDSISASARELGVAPE